jgi:CBS domain containing-hemolysin-like protein
MQIYWMNFPSLLLLAPIADVVARHWDPLIVLIAKLVTVAALVLINGFFVVAEFALVKIRDSQIKTLTDEGVRQAAFVKQIKDNLNAYLLPARSELRRAWGLVGWGTFPRANAPTVFRFAGIESVPVIKSIPLCWHFQPSRFAHRAGEQAPKILGIRKSAAALFVSAPLRWFYAIFKPAIGF